MFSEFIFKGGCACFMFFFLDTYSDSDLEGLNVTSQVSAHL